MIQKSQNGVIGLDIGVAILAIIIFTSILATVMYNIYLVSVAIKRKAEATSYIVEILEKADIEYYQDVTVDTNENINSLVTYFSQEYIERGISSIISISNNNLNPTNTKYRIIVNVMQYKENEGYLDLIKEITVTAKYYVGSKEQTIEMSSIKERENLITPNKPILENNMIPIKKVNNSYWEIASKDDTTWYNYENGYWASAIIVNENYTTSTPVGTKIEGEVEILWWIPSYAYSGTDINFLYSTTSKYVDSNGELQDLINYTPIFSNSRGEWCSDTTLSKYTTLNNSVYENKVD